MRITSRRAGPLLAVSLGVAACTGAISADNSSPGTTGPGKSSSGGSSGGGGGSSEGGGGTSEGPDSAAGDTCTSLAAIPRRLWRLSAEQWGAGVQELLGLPAAPVLTSRGGEASYAFFSDISLQVDSDMLFNQFEVVQAALATIDPTVGTTIAPCTGTTAAAQTACATSFITTFAARAYRRPLDSDEVPNLLTVYAEGAAQSYKAGVELMIEAVLLAPSFMYRTELGPSPATADASGNYPATTLTPYEVASQLSFTLLGSLPDAALTAAAADGSLGTTAGILTQIQRLLALPAVQANITNVMLGWFNVNQMFSKVHDTSLLASLSSTEQDQTGIENDLETSTQQWVSSILWNGGSGKIDDLLTSQDVYVNQRLSTLYPGLTFSGGAPTSDTTFVKATFPASQGRSGMLTQPSWVWAQSDPSLMSIVKRGKAIHDNIVCADPLGPPVDLGTPSALNVIACKSPDGTQTLSACDTEEEQSNARMTFLPCKNCHSQMDPYSRTIDSFGPIGNFQSVEDVETEAGTAATGGPVDSTVTFTPNSPLAGETMTGAQSLAKALIASGVYDGCSVQQIASYGIGSQILTYNTCELEPLRAANDGSVQSLLTNVLTANFMRARAGGSQ